MIGLMDCNNFFVSCERLFRPDLLGKPVLVLSSNDGCVVARSQEVKDLGVPMGIPYFEVKGLCTKHKVTLFSSNFALYKNVSSRVMSALMSEFDTCEVYSVDEAFFEIGDDVTEKQIKGIRARIMQKTGIPVSIGVATTKTLAKVANSIAKKRKVGHPMSNFEGVCIMDEKLWKETRGNLPCGSIWGIGRQTSASLSRHKIYTVAEFLNQDKSFIKQLLGIVGERILLELNGAVVHTIGGDIDHEQKSYTSTRSFGKPIFDKALLLNALSYHGAELAQKLRIDGNVTSKITVIARGSRFGTSPQHTPNVSEELQVPTNNTTILTKIIVKIFNTLYDPKIPYKKAGIVLNGIIPENFVAKDLFSKIGVKEKGRKIDTLTDLVNKRYGSGTLRLGISMRTGEWKSSRKFVSKEYTTRWSDIAIVKAT